MRCPECDSDDVFKDESDFFSDGQGYEWTEIKHYECNVCGCIWDEILETTRRIEIIEPCKHKKIVKKKGETWCAYCGKDLAEIVLDKLKE